MSVELSTENLGSRARVKPSEIRVLNLGQTMKAVSQDTGDSAVSSAVEAYKDNCIYFFDREIVSTSSSR